MPDPTEQDWLAFDRLYDPDYEPPEGDCRDCDGTGEVVCECDGYGCSRCLDGHRTCQNCGGSGYEPAPEFDQED